MNILRSKGLQYAPVGILFGILISLSLAASAFSPPPEPPPQGNTDAPLTVGPDVQEKTGGLILGSGLSAEQTALIAPSARVGIGTDSPGSFLDLAGALTLRGMAVPSTAPSNQGRIYFDQVSDRVLVSEAQDGYKRLRSAARNTMTLFGRYFGGSFYVPSCPAGWNDAGAQRRVTGSSNVRDASRVCWRDDGSYVTMTLSGYYHSGLTMYFISSCPAEWNDVGIALEGTASDDGVETNASRTCWKEAL